MSTEFVIKGISWPLRFLNGRVVTSTGTKHISESIFQIIGIGRGEYIMQPEFFSSLPSRVFDPVNETALLNADIADVLNNYEKRIKLLKIGTNQDNINLGRMKLEITFKVLGSDETTQIWYKQ